jgi:molybdate transport system regulatory protein
LKNTVLFDFSTPDLLGKEIALLEAIKEKGSISKAAKALPVSYKVAWEIIDSINNLAKEPVVVKSIGGSGGGGTKITPYGEKLIKDYHLIKKEYDKFISTLSKIPDIKTIKKLTLKLSARNQLFGKVIEIKKDTASAEVSFKLKSGVVLKSSITKEAADELGLDIGDEIVGIIKATSVMISGKNEFKKTTNLFEGIIEELQIGKITTNIKLHIDNLDKFWVTCKNDLIKELELKKGKRVFVFIRPKNIIIGK